MKRYGPKQYIGPNVAPMGATYVTTDAGYKRPSDWRGAVGALVRFWQDYNGVGDRTIDSVLIYPVGSGGAANYLAVGLLSNGLAVTAAAPVKAASIATPTVICTAGSKIVTRSSGSFLTDGAVKGMGLSAATALALGSAIVSVEATRLELDRAATGTSAALAARITNVPDAVRLLYLSFNAGGVELPWPVDGINFGFHLAGGATDLTGVMIEAWPVFDGSETLGSPADFNLQANG